jgi:hypothetical protein
MSLPARIWQNTSLVAAVRVKRGIHHNQLRVAIALGFYRPLESTSMVLGRVATHHHSVGSRARQLLETGAEAVPGFTKGSK